MPRRTSRSFDENAVRKAQENLVNGLDATRLADMFYILSDPSRTRIGCILTDELCVNDVCAAIGLSRYAIARHLSLMRDAGILTSRKEGTRVFYRLANPKLSAWIKMGVTLLPSM